MKSGQVRPRVVESLAAALDAEDEAAVSRGISKINSGQFVGADHARSFLRRVRNVRHVP
jgi:hypothetical protein